MAAFYLLAGRHRYRVQSARFEMYLPRRAERVEVKTIVHWMSQILLAAEIALSGLHRGMPQQELNLFQFSTVAVA